MKTSITTVQCSVEYKGLPGGVVEKLLAAGETRREELQQLHALAKILEKQGEVLVYVTGEHLECFSRALALQVLRTTDTELVMAVHASIRVLRTYAASTLSDEQAVVLLGVGGAQVVGDTTEATSGVAEAGMASILCNLPVTVHEFSGATGNWMRRGHDDPLSAGSRTGAAGATVYLSHGHFYTSLPRVTIGLMARGPEAAGGLEGRSIADGVTITNTTSITPRSMAVNGVRGIMGLLNMPGNPAVELERVVTE